MVAFVFVRNSSINEEILQEGEGLAKEEMLSKGTRLSREEISSKGDMLSKGKRVPQRQNGTGGRYFQRMERLLPNEEIAQVLWKA